ncbi:MAG: hypothetical protein U0Y68_07680 [Blastocatellia bacterium]
MSNYELHTLGLWSRQADPVNLQWLERREAIKAARKAEFQRLLQQNKQVRAQETSEIMPAQAGAVAGKRWA